MTDSAAQIAWLARRCATNNLTIRQSVALFDALWLADVLAAHNGDTTAASNATGLGRAQFYRLQNRTRVKDDPA